MRHRRLKLDTHVDSGQMYRVYWIRLLLLIRPFILSCFFLSNFQAVKLFFVTLVSGIVRPSRLKLDAHVDSGQTYCVYRNQDAAAYSFLYFFIFLSLPFSNIKNFSSRLFSGTVRPRRLKQHRCIMYTGIRLLLICRFFSFFFLSSFQTLNFLSHFSQELWCLEGWNLVHTRTMEDTSCIPKSCCCSYSSLCLFIFLSLPFSSIKMFRQIFVGNWGLEGWKFIQTRTVSSCIVYTEIRMLLLIHPFSSSFFFLASFQILNICRTFLRNCGA